ncbi:DUF4190 domain-containing protein [Streptococcus infantis]|jgi:hypothetical protein|uniref:DUF4190 domain-containing protein n=1 Tax=Streptococcus infantis TaxID=68892 RepID=UPI001CC16515|nr:DUF4190 domain-containing protein [Streptococcus infantis]MBZ2119634.1 DUF4190 domain-containing protein [Streptococcus infantis]MBZ2120994.1 DUF4190 domain-containing protein [Streptococcus infantis]MBZ2124767.1 DUF4190 domain-containing protein [Streptococcus infantis]
MNAQQKKKASLVLGILSIVLGLPSPIVGLILGIVGLVIANSSQKESGLDFKRERILSIVGIVVSVLSWILDIALFYSLARI